MKFRGYGVIWNPKKNKPMVNFKDTPEYETNDPDEIAVLSGCVQITEIIGEIKSESSSKAMTKNEVMESLDASGIEYNPRDKKEVLLALLEE